MATPSRKSAQLLHCFFGGWCFFFQSIKWYFGIFGICSFISWKNWLLYTPKWWDFPAKYYRNNELCFCLFSTRNYRLSQPRVGLIFFGNQKRWALKPCECVQNLSSGVVFSLEFPGRKYLDDFRDQIWKDEQIWTAWRSMMTRVISSWFHVLYYHIIYLICVDVSYMELKRLLFNDWCLNMFFFFGCRC